MGVGIGKRDVGTESRRLFVGRWKYNVKTDLDLMTALWVTYLDV